MPAYIEENENLNSESQDIRVIGGYKARNIGFIRYLYLVGAESIVDNIDNENLLTGQADNAVVSNGLILKATTSYNLMLFPKKACSFSESHQHTSDGEEYTCNIEMILPRTETSIRNWIHQQNNRRFVAVMQDTNGFWYQVGDADTPLVWQIETTIATTNAMKFVLRAKMWHPAWSLSNPMLYSILPTTEGCGQTIPILGYDCKAEIDEIKRRLDELNDNFGPNSGVTMIEKELKSSTQFTDSVYYQFTVGSNTYNIMGISNNDAVLLNRLKSGEIGIEEKSVRLFPIQNNQTQFDVPEELDGYKIAKFAVNHLPYSEGIEYQIYEAGGLRKIVWISTEFEIVETDLIEIFYFKVQSSQF